MTPNSIVNRKIHQRNKSIAHAKEIQTKPHIQPDKPCHLPRVSLFSLRSGSDNFSGFMDSAFVLFMISGVILLLENVFKYRVQMSPSQWHFVLSIVDFHSFALWIYSFFPICICFLIEKCLSQSIIRESLGMLAHVVNIMMFILMPIFIIHMYEDSFSLFGAAAVCYNYLLKFFKLWSYVQVNMWCRKDWPAESNSNATLRNEEAVAYSDSDIVQLVKYPDNLSISNFMHFMSAPTLCYELNFPRTTRIRKRFLLKRIFEIVIGINVMIGLVQNWMLPTIQHSLIPSSEISMAKTIELLFKLAVPFYLFFLCCFYILFHSYLNLVAELTRFADRNFYNDWWNASNTDTYWQKWNQPVHSWGLRHIYTPLRRSGYSRLTSALVVFFISAIAHEYFASVPSSTFKLHAFMGMLFQIPLSFLSRYVEKHCGPKWGNAIVWALMIFGTSFCCIIYLHDYIVEHFNETIRNSEIKNSFKHDLFVANETNIL